ncbi:nonsense-mediated mRNA decay protein 3 [Trichodelitschia bisporula]|uniref:60S ribosomal export protein NMD3 n=1 Tax=Trichodelitschia bisporula TaxID=703511 RepID=A0A6G1IA69_9PEZI|nr:nonsense-mediated mRNA decay protein 3 [Trichodelitschia bisporula]
MEVDSVALPHLEQQTAATILCCNCGVPIDGTTSAGALCNECLKLSVDISNGIPREAVLLSCSDCDRWLSPPSSWLVAAPESRELLAICLRKLKGLTKVRIIDASFVWTEPHSKRIKVRITVQQEAFQGTIVQQTFEVEYVLANQQCPDCKKSYTHHTWRACVQVRQKVPHKRTFLFLEQLILKHNAHRDTINIKEVHDGIDFFFSARNQAEKFIDFLTSVTPALVKKSQELISHDVHTSVKQYKFSYSAELVPLCKDDLVALPIKLAKSIGDIPPLVLVYRVGTEVNVLDPVSLKTGSISTREYWHSPFTSLAQVKDLVEFIVLEVEPLGPQKGHFVLAEATVSLASDMSTTFYARTHLGGVLHPGDSVLGYNLTGSNYNNDCFEALEASKQYGSTVPDVMLVRKFYARKKKNKSRNWRLKRMAREESEMLARKQDEKKAETDYELFLRDVEEDEDLRSRLNLYKTPKLPKVVEEDMMEVEEETDVSEDEGLQVPMEQLLEDMGDMTIEDEQ